ncbi:MAG: 1,4-alpha-glucan branching protein GlgB [Polyangiaceae bacterium]
MALPEELNRVALLLHPDPHAVLGAHVESGWGVLRVFRRAASKVTFHLDGRAIPAAKRALGAPLDKGAVFEAHVDAELARGADPAKLTVETHFEGGAEEVRADPYFFKSSIGELDLHLFAEGKHDELYRHLGANPMTRQGVEGTSFTVWAPNAAAVRLIGDFNAWAPWRGAMRRLPSGVWELFVPDVGDGALYKFEVLTRSGTKMEKSDPFGRAMEVRPGTASRVVVSKHAWSDAAWIERRSRARPDAGPLSIYEVHLASWKRRPRQAAPGEPPLLPEHRTRWLTYRELADELVDHVAAMGFTHVELLPVMEHPYDGSWGYQVSGYYAATSRYGSPDDLRYLVDRFHAKNIGVLLDWVPAHFPKDAAALGRFDGTPLFEHADPRRGEHHHWGTFIFDFGRNEVKNFLIASALYWISEFHVDGLRVDAVASMLYLDYSARTDDDWTPNRYGGNENLEAVAFLRELTTRVHARFPGALLVAEESTTWPGVTKPAYAGGLGFDLKWNMGWMHDTLKYFALDPFFRSFNHALLTFGIVYAFSERFLLPLSHDEVVHLKKSLLSKMAGEPDGQRASLRTLFAYMWTHPGKKLLFMGAELGQTTEWNHEAELPWSLLGDPKHAGIRAFLADLNALYRSTPALFELDDDPRGFQWIDANEARLSIASFIRFPKSRLKRRRTGTHVVFVANFTPVERSGYRLGVPRAGAYLERINSDAAVYGGENRGNMGRVVSEEVASHGFDRSIVVYLPPLSAMCFVPEEVDEPTAAEVEAERVAIEEELRVKMEEAERAARAEEEREQTPTKAREPSADSPDRAPAKKDSEP